MRLPRTSQAGCSVGPFWQTDLTPQKGSFVHPKKGHSLSFVRKAKGHSLSFIRTPTKKKVIRAPQKMPFVITHSYAQKKVIQKCRSFAPRKVIRAPPNRKYPSLSFVHPKKGHSCNQGKVIRATKRKGHSLSFIRTPTKRSFNSKMSFVRPKKTSFVHLQKQQIYV